MATLQLHQPGKINATITLPENWDELTTAEMEQVSKAYLADAEDSIFKSLISWNILLSRCENLNLPRNYHNLFNAEDVVLQVFPALEFIIKKNNRTKQPYSKIKLPGLFATTVYGPQDDFNNLTCGEFEDAEVFYNEFRENPNGESLARMAAVLYRPVNMPYISYHKSQHKFITYDSESMFKKFYKLSPWVLYTIFLWYCGCKLHLQELFNDAFEKSTGQPDPMAFTRTIHAAAGPKNGTREQVRLLLIKELFFDMAEESRKTEELKQAYEQLKR